MAREKRNIQNAYNEPFACRLRALLEKNKISQSELAAEIGLTRQAINNYTLGITVPNADVLARLSKKYNVSVDYLLGLAETPVTDKDINYICEYTGLSLAAVENLHQCATEINNIPQSDIDKVISSMPDDTRTLSEKGAMYLKYFISYLNSENKDFIFILSKLLEANNSPFRAVILQIGKYIETLQKSENSNEFAVEIERDYAEYLIYKSTKEFVKFADDIKGEFIEFRSAENGND